MSGNTIGKLFCVSTAGESHGTALTAIVDGCPAGLALSTEDLQGDLNRRKPGQSKFTTQRREADEVKILSGVFEGKTTGTPITLLIENTDQRSKDYTEISEKFRPGHADYTYFKKYGHRDYRGGGRSSARVLAMVVAAGAIAKKYLQQSCGLSIQGYVAQIGEIAADSVNFEQIENNPLFFPDATKLAELEAYMTQLRRDGDSIGAKVVVHATQVPAGLGEPIFDKLDAEIAYAMMGINAVKAVEIGVGDACVTQRGSEHRDQIDEQGFLSNNAGGILGGISSGQDIIVQISLKPTSSITTPGKTIDLAGKATDIITKGRHDPCVGIRAVPIAEAMLAIVLMDHFLRNNAI